MVSGSQIWEEVTKVWDKLGKRMLLLRSLLRTVRKDFSKNCCNFFIIPIFMQYIGLEGNKVSDYLERVVQ